MPVRGRARENWGAALALARSPRCWLALATGGRTGLLSEALTEGITQLRIAPRLMNLASIAAAQPRTLIGKFGGMQEYLYEVIRFCRPQTVVETGVNRGISTAFILAGLDDNRAGILYSIDQPSASYRSDRGEKVHEHPIPRGAAPGFLVPERLRARWRLMTGRSQEVLPGLLSDLGTIDVFFHDSEHTYKCMSWEYEQAIRHIRDGGFLCSDDVNWNEAFRDFVTRYAFENWTIIRGRLGIGRVSRKGS